METRCIASPREHEMKLLTHNRTEGVMLKHSKHVAKCLLVLVILSCLSFSLRVYAQNRDTIQNRRGAKFKPGKPLLVIDGRVCSYDTLASINSADIFKIDTLKSVTKEGVYKDPADYGAIIVTTNVNAIAQCQKKFSAFSKKYKDYNVRQQGKDDSCTYIVDGAILPNDSRIKAEKLYYIKSQKIKKVEIIENPWYNGGESRKYLVVIDIKN